jgi:hypothetical protein
MAIGGSVGYFSGPARFFEDAELDHYREGLAIAGLEWTGAAQETLVMM